MLFSAPEPKAHGELIVWYLSQRPCIRPCVHIFKDLILKHLGQSKPNFI